MNRTDRAESRLMCRSCAHQGSVTAGTIFDKTRTPLRVWLAAAWYVTNQKLGVSALGLKRVLGLGSYETAWTMLHRFRRAMVRPERELLKGEVEVDERETYLVISDRENRCPARDVRARRTRSSWPLPWKFSSPRASVGSACAASTTTPMPAWCRSCRTTSSAVREC